MAIFTKSSILDAWLGSEYIFKKKEKIYPICWICERKKILSRQVENLSYY